MVFPLAIDAKKSSYQTFKRQQFKIKVLKNWRQKATSSFVSFYPKKSKHVFLRVKKISLKAKEQNYLKKKRVSAFSKIYQKKIQKEYKDLNPRFRKASKYKISNYGVIRLEFLLSTGKLIAYYTTNNNLYHCLVYLCKFEDCSVFDKDVSKMVKSFRVSGKWTFVDGDTADGINKDDFKSADHPQLTVFDGRLYAIWVESYNNINQVRIAVYNGRDVNPTWTFVDGNTVYGINKDYTKDAGKPQLTVFNGKLYAGWKEDNGIAYQIRVAVFNSNNSNPAWFFVDSNTVNGINKDNTKNADALQLTVFNEKLYVVWKEDNGIAGQVRVVVYSGNDSSPAWSFVDGNTVNGINKDNTKNIYAPQLTVFSAKLYAIWKENNSTADQIRVAVYNSNDISPVWSFVDGNTANGINWDNTKNAYYPQLTVFNEKLYAIWRENNSVTDQIRVAVYNGNDTNSMWTFVDGDTNNGINKNPANFSDTPQLTVFNEELYATWVEKNSKAEQVRIAVYNNNDVSPVWTFVDGNTANGINKDKTESTDSSQLIVFNKKLYATWSEDNSKAWQVRVAVKQ